MQKTSSADIGNPLTFRDGSKVYKLAIQCKNQNSGEFKRFVLFTQKLVKKSVPPALAKMKELGVTSIPIVTKENVLSIAQSIALHAISEKEEYGSLYQVINSLSTYKKGDGRFSLRGQTVASVVAHVVANNQFTCNHQDAIAVNIFSEVWSALNNLAAQPEGK